MNELSKFWAFSKIKDKQTYFNTLDDLWNFLIDYMTEILSMRLEDTMCTRVIFRCWRWVYSVTTKLSWVLGEPHYGKDDGSARRAPLHYRVNKCWLYWMCPIQRNVVMLVVNALLAFINIDLNIWRSCSFKILVVNALLKYLFL